LAPIFTSSSRVTATVRRKSPAYPCILRSAGRTNSSKLTIAETGFPDSPSQGTSLSMPKASGAPGRIFTFQNFCLPPSDSKTSRV